MFSYSSTLEHMNVYKSWSTIVHVLSMRHLSHTLQWMSIVKHCWALLNGLNPSLCIERAYHLSPSPRLSLGIDLRAQPLHLIIIWYMLLVLQTDNFSSYLIAWGLLYKVIFYHCIVDSYQDCLIDDAVQLLYLC